ncbi:pH-response regulator protein palH/Rim21p [Monosporozyma unispora]|nr:pH-response regulator protein palH/rim21 [Kazachstania unispora]
MDGNIWRISNMGGFQSYQTCMKLNLGNGILISRDIPNPVLYADHIQFRSYCYTFRPVYMAAKHIGVPATYLPMFKKDWDAFTSVKNKVGRDFTSGIFPLLMSYSANFVLTVFLTFLSFLIIKSRPYLFASVVFKVGCLFCTVNLIVAMSQMFILLRDQHVNQGVTISSQVIKLLAHSATFISLHFLSILTLQLSQVFIIMRTFERNREKRIILLCGIILTITTSVLWVAPQLGTVVRQKKIDWDILPVFVYLFRIAIEALYTCFILSYAVRQRKVWSKNFQMIFLTFLTVLSVLLLPGFFLADVANAWIAEFGEIFTDVCYISSTFLPWEWLERLAVLQRTERAQSVLGRPIYDNEQQDFAFAKYTLKVQDALQRHNDNNSMSQAHHERSHDTTNSPTTNTVWNGSEDENYELHDLPTSSLSMHGSNHVLVGSSTGIAHNAPADHESINEVNFNAQERKSDILRDKIISTYNKFIYFTDQVILKKLGTDSVNSISNNDTSKSSNKKRQQLIKKRIGLERPPETYLYNTKDVVFDSDGSEESGDDSENPTDGSIDNNNVSNNYDLGNNLHDGDIYYDEDFERDFGKYTHPGKK